MVQQLATKSSLHRWGKATDASCPLCHNIQTNKHVLNNCPSAAVLERYKTRHNAILRLIADWLKSNTKPDSLLHADLPDMGYRPLSKIFNTLRPDVAVVNNTDIHLLELTICHETNLGTSKVISCRNTLTYSQTAVIHSKNIKFI